jgi:hypothetical protein
MTIPANLLAEATPWGAIPITVCWGAQGGPYQTASAANPLPVNVVAGGSGASTGTDGAAVPGSDTLVGLNVGGNLHGWTGVNPSGTVYAGQVDLASVGGTSVVTSLAGAPGVGGDTANAAADAGNPVKVGGQGNSAKPAAVSAGQRVNGWWGLNGQLVVGLPAVNVSGDGNTAVGWIDAGGNTGRAALVALTGYNGTGTAAWDRWANNQDLTLLASAARTATTNTADQTNANGKGVVVYLAITAASGTGGLQVSIQGKDPVSGNYFLLATLGAAVTTTGNKAYMFYPGAASGGSLQAGAQMVLPRTWRVQIVHGDGTSYTYSVGCSVVV